MEDDKEIRDGVEIYLKNQGYQVWKAANGKEGLEIVAQEEIHLAILDIMMPVMDGVTMLMKLREQNHEFPVIMLSAKSEEVDKIMGLNMGADDYVTKPFTPLELLARVNSHLRRYSKYLTAVSGEEQEKSHVYTIVCTVTRNEMNMSMEDGLSSNFFVVIKDLHADCSSCFLHGTSNFWNTAKDSLSGFSRHF